MLNRKFMELENGKLCGKLKCRSWNLNFEYVYYVENSLMK